MNQIAKVARNLENERDFIIDALNNNLYDKDYKKKSN